MGVRDHFDTSAYEPHPAYEKGALVHDNSDPTYGDRGLSLGPDIYECLTCGAAVLNPRQHAEWHDEQAPDNARDGAS